MAQAHTVSLFSFAGITAALVFDDFDACDGHVEARGFDCGGDYHEANVAGYYFSFVTPAGRDMAVANAMNFVATEMLKQAAWQAA